MDRDVKAAYDREYRKANAAALKAKAREYYRKNRERILERGKAAYRASPEQRRAYAAEYARNRPEYVLFSQARFRARKRGIEFSIDITDIRIPETCPLLGVTLGAGEYAPSLDRIDPKRGYVPDNIHVISIRANRIKNDATPSELILIGTRLLALVTP